MSSDERTDEMYCSACGCHFYEDEIAQDGLLRDVCPHCGSTDIWLVQVDDDGDWIYTQEPPQEPDYMA